MKLIDKARDFLSKKSEQQQAVTARKQELSKKLAVLEEQRQSLIDNYNPDHFSADDIKKIDQQIADVKMELEVNDHAWKAGHRDNQAEIIDMIKKIREEVAQSIDKKREEDKRLRGEILQTKEQYLSLIQQHAELRRETADIGVAADEVINSLDSRGGISQAADKLNRDAQKADHQIFEMSRDTTTGIDPDQWKSDELYRQKCDLIRKRNELTALLQTNRSSIPELSSYRDPNGKSIYFIK